MKTSTNLFKLFAGLSAFLGITACEEAYEYSLVPHPMLVVAEHTLNFEQEGSSEYVLDIRCNEEYTVKLQNDLSSWCSINKNDIGDLEFVVSENDKKNVRKGEFYIVTPTQADTVKVAQLGWGKAILLSPETINMEEAGGNFTLKVTSNIPYKINLEGCDWVVEKPQTRSESHEPVDTEHLFSVKANKGERRSIVIPVADAEAGSEIEGANLTIMQNGLGNYNPSAPDEGEDIQIFAESITGDGSANDDRPYTRMLDGDKSSGNFWQAYWPGTKVPEYIEFSFSEPQDLDYVIYYPSYSGHFTDIEIEAYSEVNKQRTEGYTTVYSGTLTPTSAPTRIDFNQSATRTTKLRFTLKTCNDGVFRCSEMEFFKKNPLAFDYTTLFANPACTELKSDITEEDILSCSHSFYKNLAWYMYNDKYPREFRIAEYKAYPYPYIQANANKTSKYSLLDNPTGISVAADENLVVMADLKGRESIKIRVQNLDTPGEDGFHTGVEEYTVENGLNTLRMKSKGLVYVMYNVDYPENEPIITLHFASGKVNGYFDSQNPNHKGRWKEFLTNATDKYFDVLGKYAHLTFPILHFQNNTKEGEDLINLYDELVYREQEFLGLEKYNRMFKNRMYFNVIYKSYMYATDFHTAYNETTLKELTDETLFKANCWGPAHEVGHCNQTRPGLKWHGMTEVTNNITSLYIQTSVFNEPSRLEQEERYAQAWNSIMVPQEAHNGAEIDVFCKLVPFWQLELYYGKALGRTPMQQADHGGFYPDVYEYVRTNQDLSTPGAQQLEFVFNCCKAAQANLLDFFGKWGFLTPIDTEIDDYGKGQFTITQRDIDDLKSRVEGLGYAKPDVALEYITDYTVDAYKNKASVTKGTCTRNGNVLTLNNWKNVAAFEVKDNLGQLVAIAEGATPTATAENSPFLPIGKMAIRCLPFQHRANACRLM